MKRTFLFLFFVIGISGLIIGYSQDPITSYIPVNKAKVPALIGENKDKALQMINDSGLRRGNIVETEGDQPRGTVISQFPDSGLVVDRGTKVNMTVSLGPAKVSVPNLIGKTPNEARIILSDNQLRPGQENEQISDGELGVIISQDPQPGNLVPKGFPVNFTLAIKNPSNNVEILPGRKLTTVPDVIGLPLKDALFVIKKAGLRANVVRNQKTNLNRSRVVWQDPRKGENVIEGTVVKLKAENYNLPVPPTPQTPTPPTTWLYLAGGIIAVVLLGGYLGLKSAKANQVRKKARENEPELKLKIIHDRGEQLFQIQDNQDLSKALELKIIPDKGVQTIRIN